MRLLFLDFDGVLNSIDWIKRRPSQDHFREFAHEEQIRWALSSVDPEAVRRVDYIASMTKARVVISSSWRTMFSLNRLQRILRFHGFTHHLLGATPDSTEVRVVDGHLRATRGDEIMAWLKLFDPNMIGVEDIAILDDDADMGAFTDRLVQTSYETGLQDEHVQRVINLYR